MTLYVNIDANLVATEDEVVEDIVDEMIEDETEDEFYPLPPNEIDYFAKSAIVVHTLELNTSGMVGTQ